MPDRLHLSIEETDEQAITPGSLRDLDLWSQAGWQHYLDWDPSPTQIGQLQQLYDWVIEGNQTQNLTRITESVDFWEKHLWDSLRPLQALPVGILAPRDNLEQDDPAAESFYAPYTVIDIGSGAGFPGIPVAIANPEWRVTLLDATQRRMQFAEMVAAKVGLRGIQVQAERAETWGQLRREGYDLALNRALGSAVVCAELSMPMLKIGGHALLYRGHWDPDQESALQRACQKLGQSIK
ncbi:MAG: 16S rRNA (guanine(527)-N(7))-methyltransferase RsmG, partial [Synechococcaceae cyanobacterium RM1_1_27]|nr:16S rRNA (guanine(527)-N(7))-methyltransferase RsmG [Synechococcaceae cyanobacterium RM1_1_27]